MGNKVSVVHGVKSADFYHQDNAINEIWIGDVELVSRLPFGDSDLGQASWPKGTWPKIPWHQFIIPLKRSINVSNETIMASNETVCSCPGTIRFDWPDTGFYSIYKGLPQEVAYVFGALIIGFAVSLMLLPFIQRDLPSRELTHYRRFRLHAPRASLASMVNKVYWYWTCFTLCVWIVGLILFVLAIPLVLWSAQRFSLTAFVGATALDAAIISSLTVLYQLVRLFIWRRRALAKQQQTTNTDEKTLEDDLPEVNLEERLDDLVQVLTECPQCKRNCYCEIS